MLSFTDYTNDRHFWMQNNGSVHNGGRHLLPALLCECVSMCMCHYWTGWMCVMPSQYTQARASFSRRRKSSKSSLRRAGAAGQEEEQMAGSSTIILPHSPMETREQGQLAWQIGGREREVTEGYSIILSIILYPPEWNEGGLKNTQHTPCAPISPPETGAGCHLSFWW